MELDNDQITALVLWLWRRKIERKQRRLRRVYVRGINLDRQAVSDLATLIMPMRNQFDQDHFDYFRMTRFRFDDLLRRIQPWISHANTHRMPITPLHRLGLTLR
jgi:hypothetical protein